VSQAAYSVSFVHLANAALVAIAAIVLGAIVARTERTIWLALFAGVIFTASPFAVSVILDPLGAESVVGLVLVLLLAGDLIGAYGLPAALRVAIPALIAIQAPEFTLVSIAYAIAGLGERRAISVAALISTIVASAPRFLPGAPSWLYVLPSATSGRSFSITVIAIAVACFVLVPLGITVGRAVPSRFGLRTSRALLVASIALSALVGGLWLPIDPSVALLAAEACAILAIATVSPDPRLGCAGLVLVAVASAVDFSRVVSSLPSAVIAKESADIRSLLRESGEGTVCVVESTPDEAGVFSGGALVRLYGAAAKVNVRPTAASCFNPSLGSLPTAVAVIGEDKVVRTWGSGSLPLALAAMTEDRPGVIRLPVTIGRAIPRTKIPGAFENHVDAPQGGVPAFTIIAGYAFEFPCIPVRKPSVLTFVASDPLADVPHAAPVRIVVRVNGIQRLAATLSPADHGSSYWTSFHVPLRGRSRCAQITFSATAPTGSQVGSWAAIAAPVIADPREWRP
jgi:hypothetical protein